MTRATLLVLAKEPVPGRVKTRLCPPCTPDQAAQIAAAAIADALAAVLATPEVRRVLVLDGTEGPWIPSEFDVVPQVGDGLAERLAAAFSGATGPTLLIGMDTPQVTPALLGDAVNTLRRPGVDAVLGPTIDGGWWIIGLRDPHVPAFDGVPMSTPDTGHAQRTRLDQLGLRTRTLATETDVDTFADARTVAAQIPSSRFAGAVLEVARRLELDAPAQT